MLFRVRLRLLHQRQSGLLVVVQTKVVGRVHVHAGGPPIGRQVVHEREAVQRRQLVHGSRARPGAPNCNLMRESAAACVCLQGLKGRSRIIERAPTSDVQHTHTHARAHAHCTGATSGAGGACGGGGGRIAGTRTAGARARPSTWWSRATRMRRARRARRAGRAPRARRARGQRARRAREPGREPRALLTSQRRRHRRRHRAMSVLADRARVSGASLAAAARRARRARRRQHDDLDPNNPIPSARAPASSPSSSLVARLRRRRGCELS